MFYVIEGELRPKVYSDLASARRACTSPLWTVHTFHSLAEAGAAREKFRAKSAPNAEKKRQRSSETQRMTQREFEDKAGVQEEEENAGFGRWLSGQQFGDAPQYYDPDKEREYRAAKVWFEEYKKEKARKQEEKKRMAEEETKNGTKRQKQHQQQQQQQHQQQQQQKQQRPPFVATKTGTDKVRDALRCIGIDLAANLVTRSMLKAAKHKTYLETHPDKHEGASEEELKKKTIQFRDAVEALKFLNGLKWAEDEKAD